MRFDPVDFVATRRTPYPLESRRAACKGVRGWVLAALGVWLAVAAWPAPVRAEITAKRVLESIDRAKRFLIRSQAANGSFSRGGGGDGYQVGITSLAVMALINIGEPLDSPAVAGGLKFLRNAQLPNNTYEVSLMIQAFAAAKDGKKDLGRILSLVRKLEQWQVDAGPNAGSWTYGMGGGGDRSNGQFAILGLREAQEAGVSVSLNTWKRARKHWIDSQNGDGGWGYSGGPSDDSRGSMTVAGVASLVITDAMVRLGDQDLKPDGTVDCCGKEPEDTALERGLKWLGNNFSVQTNPKYGAWFLYYMYGLERAGRLSGRRFFGEGANKHDWYREGAEHLVDRQSVMDGSWRTETPDGDPVVGTCFCLLFLSKGFAPVLINKLEYGPRDPAGLDVVGNDWNRHKNDVRNLTQYITGLPKWPKLLNWQIVPLPQATVADLMQAPVLFFNGTEAPKFTPAEVALLREYVQSGGFIYAEAVCQSKTFDAGFRELVAAMFPNAEAKLKQLPPEHPIYRSEFPLDPATVELWGVDVGCRTSIVYSPNDWACLWDKWTSFDIPDRKPQTLSMIGKGTKLGVNIVAYATGRELMNKLDQQELAALEGEQERITRGLIEIAKLRHTGGWDAAPQALRNLLLALNKTSGALANPKVRDLTPLDVNLFNYPLVYAHGRNNFTLNEPERKRLREYLDRGGVLFADSCCGAAQFDKSFRELVTQMYPDKKFERIPATHEMFSATLGHDLRQVKRRELDSNPNDPAQALATVTRTVEPFFEGIQVDGKYVVIYSKYDLSCALERQASVTCTGYVHEDAVKLAVNIVLYTLLQ